MSDALANAARLMLAAKYPEMTAKELSLWAQRLVDDNAVSIGSNGGAFVPADAAERVSRFLPNLLDVKSYTGDGDEAKALRSIVRERQHESRQSQQAAIVDRHAETAARSARIQERLRALPPVTSSSPDWVRAHRIALREQIYREEIPGFGGGDDAA